MGVCLALTEPCPLADKHCQLAAGLHSLAMCSLLINRTHSRRQVQANTKPFPWAVGFSSCLHRCQLKRFLGFFTKLWDHSEDRYGKCVWWGGREWTHYCTVPLFLSLWEILHQTKHETKIMRLAWQSWMHSEEDRKWELSPLWGLSIFFFCLS